MRIQERTMVGRMMQITYRREHCLCSLRMKRCSVCKIKHEGREERRGDSNYCSPEHSAMTKYLIAIPGGGFELSETGVKKVLRDRFKSVEGDRGTISDSWTM